MNSTFRRLYFLFPITTFLFFLALPSVNAEITRTLQLGSAGPDVKELQILLNSDPQTIISSSGTGSPGKESDYFGILTKRAVEAFQKKYAPEVLFPAGIWQPTGIVGLYSRNKLNTLARTGTFNDPQPQASEELLPASIKTAIPASSVGSPLEEVKSGSVSIYSIFATKSKPLIFNLSRYQAKSGTSISVLGSGFLPTGNSIVFSPNSRIDNLTSANGSTLDFVVPNTLPQGAYNLSVENKNGSSFNATYGNFFSVTETPADPPKVYKVSPDSVSYDANSVITIEGEGFSSSGNDVFVNFGTASNIASSDGKTLKVSLSAFSGFAQAGSQSSLFNKSKLSIPVSVAVKNPAGISGAGVSFLLQY